MDFRALEAFLRSHNEDEFTVTFSEIEEATGAISPSYISRRHLEGEYSFKNHVTNAGFSISNVNYETQEIIFKRTALLQNILYEQQIIDMALQQEEGSSNSSTITNSESINSIENSQTHSISKSQKTKSSSKWKIDEEIRNKFNNDLCSGRLSSRKIKCTGSKPYADIYNGLCDIYKKVAFGAQKRPALKEPVNETELELLNAMIEKLAKMIYDYFTKTPNTKNNQKSFDRFHNSLCSIFVDDLTKIYNKYAVQHNYTRNDYPSYGNAQKIINMVFKYLACYSDYEDYADLFSYCHIPIDEKILENLSAKFRMATVSKKSGIVWAYKGKVWTEFSKSEYLNLVKEYRKAMKGKIGKHSWIACDFYLWAEKDLPETGSFATYKPQFYM